MRRSARTLIGLAAATAAIAVSVPALATSASASTATAAKSSPSWDYDHHWGPYWSKNHLAKAKGFIDVDYDHAESNKVRISGKLYDLDHRTYGQGGKCAYVKFRVQYWDDHEDDWSHEIKSYKYCGAGGHKAFTFWRYDVAQVQAKVCQIGLYSNYPTKCGYWHELYNAYDEDYDYHA
jgi:hypothetical protein